MGKVFFLWTKIKKDFWFGSLPWFRANKTRLVTKLLGHRTTLASKFKMYFFVQISIKGSDLVIEKLQKRGHSKFAYWTIGFISNIDENKKKIRPVLWPSNLVTGPGCLLLVRLYGNIKNGSIIASSVVDRKLNVFFIHKLEKIWQISHKISSRNS